MSAFQQALANAVNQPAPSSSGSVSIRGAASARPSRGGGRGGSSSRSHAHNTKGTPYSKAPTEREGGRRRAYAPGGAQEPSVLSLAARIGQPGSGGGRGGAGAGGRPGDPRRNPVGTRGKDAHVRTGAQRSAHAKLSEKLGSEDMKAWLRNRVVKPGVVDMSGLGQDPWLTEQGILPPGHPDAPPTAGTIFWKLLDQVVQQPSDQPIHTLRLSNNNFRDLHMLDRLAFSLPHLQALDLSQNPIQRVVALDSLLGASEKKGKANAGAGSLNNLIELKLNDCTFRETMLAAANGAETYQHEILRRFPGLLILDGVLLNRVVFPIQRKPKVRHTEQKKREFVAKPFTFPMDVQGGFLENDILKDLMMSFCDKFFPLFDNDRKSLLPAYSPQATISISVNSLRSRSYLAEEMRKAPRARPNSAPFEAWQVLPSRNFLQPSAKSIDQRMRSLKSPMEQAELLRWWDKAVPKTQHPMSDLSKWCIDAWVLDGEGLETKLCAMIEGEFAEMPSESLRSFSRTFILADAPQGSPAQQAGFPATILSDTLVVHHYYSNGAFDDARRSVAQHGVKIQPPTPGAGGVAMSGVNGTGGPTDSTQQAGLIAQMRQRTGMNEQFATLCLAQNEWHFEQALQNFEEIRSTIPPEAFQ